MGDDNRQVTFTIGAKDQITSVLQKVIAALKQLDDAGNKQTPLAGLDKAEKSAAKLDTDLQNATKDMKKLGDETTKVATQLKAMGGDGSGGAAAAGGASAAGGKGGAIAGIAGGLALARTSAARFAGALGVALAAMDALQASWESGRSILAALNNEGDEQVKHAQEAKKVIESFPIVGGVITAVGQKINDFATAIINLSSGKGFKSDSTFAEKILGDAEKLDKHTEKMHAFAEAEKDVIAQTKEMVKQLKEELKPFQSTDQDRALDEIEKMRKQRDELLRLPGMQDMKGQITAAGQQFLDLTNRMFTDLSLHTNQEFLDKAKAAEAKLVQLKLEGNDRVNEAERVGFDVTNREREVEAGKTSVQVARITERINAQIIDNFTKKSEEARKRIGMEFSADLEARNIAAKGTFDAKQAADRVTLNLKQQIEMADTLKKLRGAGIDEEGVSFGKDLLSETQELERRALARQQFTDQAAHDVDRLGTHQGDLNFQIERSARLYQDGAVSLHDATDKQQRDIEAFGEELNRVAADIDGKLAKGIMNPDDAEELRRRLAQVREDLARTRTETQRLAAGLENDTANAISTFAQSAITNFGNIRGAFGSMLESFGNSIIKLQTDAFAKSITSQLSGGQSGGGLFGFLTGGATEGGEQAGGLFGGLFKGIGKLFGFAQGGLVPGSGSGDTVSAMLTPQEYIIPAPIVRHLGVDYFDRLIGRHHLQPQTLSPLMPARFAAGGMVPGRSEVKTIALPLMAANDQQMATLLRGGHTAVMRYFSAHSSEINSILGRL